MHSYQDMRGLGLIAALLVTKRCCDCPSSTVMHSNAAQPNAAGALQVIATLVRSLVARIHSLISHRCATPAARRVLELLAGITLLPCAPRGAKSNSNQPTDARRDEKEADAGKDNTDGAAGGDKALKQRRQGSALGGLKAKLEGSEYRGYLEYAPRFPSLLEELVEGLAKGVALYADVE